MERMGDILYGCGEQENHSEFLRKSSGKCAFAKPETEV
jgi:hypothetical protein